MQQTHPLEKLWHLLLGGETAQAAALLAPGSSWDDPLFNLASGEAVAGVAIPRLSAWYREKAAGGPAGSPIQHLRTTADGRRVIVESILTLRDGLIWNQATQAAEESDRYQLAVAVVGDRAAGAPGAYSAIRIYFGTWAVLKGQPRARFGPVAPDERAETAQAIAALPLVRDYFDCLATGAPRIIDLFEPDGYFREPANNFACGDSQLRAHFVHILKLGGVGIEFLTAVRQDERLGLELQTITWGTKKMDRPQAGFAIYELGPHGKIQGSRVYDSVVPPEF